MRNPWLTKNPFLSVWLSSANKVLGSARGQATAATQRELTSVRTQATRQMLDFWSGRTAATPLPKKRAKKAR
jgi:hypothetical protein